MSVPCLDGLCEPDFCRGDVVTPLVGHGAGQGSMGRMSNQDPACPSVLEGTLRRQGLSLAMHGRCGFGADA